MHVVPLTLLPFADVAVTAALQGVLRGLGYTVRPWCGSTPPPGPDASSGPFVVSGPTVVLFGHGRNSWRLPERVALAGLREHPALALVMDEAEGWNHDLIADCCECAHWPCSSAELAFRLGRLCARMPPAGAAGAPDPLLADALARCHLIGRSPVFLGVMARLQRLVRCDAPVLIEGETGTGKELVARAIHYLGGRSGGPFVPVNCGALPDQLIENELFGHERGAYTDAKGASAGAIGEAAGGTLFLDEVEALSPKAQAALLRFLQDHEYRPLGAARARTSDARVVAASNADLRALAGRRGFRADLFFRLEVLSVTLPPLRAREGDAEVLARHFIDRFCRQYGLATLALDRRSLPALDAYPWPGNVRELENLVHRSVLMAEGGVLQLHPGGALVSAVAPGLARSVAPGAEPLALELGFATAKAHAIAAFERRYLLALMQATGGNVTQAARRAAKERRALGKLLKKHAIVVTGDADDPHPGC